MRLEIESVVVLAAPKGFPVAVTNTVPPPAGSALWAACRDAYCPVAVPTTRAPLIFGAVTASVVLTVVPLSHTLDEDVLVVADAARGTHPVVWPEMVPPAVDATVTVFPEGVSVIFDPAANTTAPVKVLKLETPP